MVTFTPKWVSRNALASDSRQKRQPGANAQRLIVQIRWHWANALRLITNILLQVTCGGKRDNIGGAAGEITANSCEDKEKQMSETKPDVVPEQDC